MKIVKDNGYIEKKVAEELLSRVYDIWELSSETSKLAGNEYRLRLTIEGKFDYSKEIGDKND